MTKKNEDLKEEPKKKYRGGVQKKPTSKEKKGSRAHIRKAIPLTQEMIELARGERCVLGRPSAYSEELADHICQLVATHKIGLDKIVEMHPELPASKTIYAWRYNNEIFRRKYASAKAAQSDLLAEEILDISDYKKEDNRIDENGRVVADIEYIQRSRLRVDSRKWIASKMLPKIYGDARQVEQLSNENEFLRKELLELRAKLDKKNEEEY